MPNDRRSRPAKAEKPVADLLERLRLGAAIDQPVAIVAAHPDDETLGLGSRLGYCKRLIMIHLTDGAPRNLDDAHREGFDDWRSYAEARRKELCCAFSRLGASAAVHSFHDHPDQRSIFHGAQIVHRLADELANMAAVVTHPYEHGHPDHDTAALAVQLACRAMDEAGQPAPARYEFASYHLAAGEPVFGGFWPDTPETPIHLSSEELAAKREAVDCFVTQRSVLASFPLSPERLRPAPDYDFTRPAPPGDALYDLYRWEITADTWREEAARVLQSFHSGPSSPTRR